MHCPNQILHTVERGDTLYRIALTYQTSVPVLLALNPGVEIYNLQIGSTVRVCPGVSAVNPPIEVVPPIGTLPPPIITPLPPIGTLPPVMPVPPIGTIPECLDVKLSNMMRKLWSQHVYWTRMLIISIAHHLPDQDVVAKRLLENPGDFASVFEMFFPSDLVAPVTKLFTEHLTIAADLVTALRDKQSIRAAELSKKWYDNADELVDALVTMNPGYNREQLRDMFHEHLRLTTDEAAMRLTGNYEGDIKAFNNVEKSALEMADFFTAGLPTTAVLNRRLL